MARTTLLSPRRYQRSGFGQALPPNFSLSSLRSTIIRAQSLVDRYCNLPNRPSLFDWRGGTMTDEQHQWRIVNPLAYGPGARRVYTNVGPLKTVTALHLDLGKTYQVALNPAVDIYVNSMEQYAEIVAVNPTIVGFYPLAVNLGLYNPIARISYTYGWSFPVAGDVLEAESPTSFSAAYGNWDTTVVPVVYLNGVVANPSTYVVDYSDGVIDFTSGPATGAQVSADYTYTVPSPVVDAIGVTTTALLGKARLAARGMIGLSSLRVAEITLTQMSPAQMQTRNGATIPEEAAELLGNYVMGSAA
jgi:hypothetical protein